MVVKRPTFWHHTTPRPSKWRINEQKWYNRFLELRAYKQKYGNCNVPRNWPENKHLSLWVKWQRAEKPNLPNWRVQLLDEIGFAWQIQRKNRSWKESYEQVKAFYQKHGHFEITRSDPLHRSLGNWCATQSRSYRKGTLHPGKVKLLNAINFKWREGVKTISWEERYENLREFKATFGHCNVPPDYSNKHLADWITYQKRARKQGKLAPQKEILLDELGILWESYSWSKRYEELKEFKKIHGHCRVPRFPLEERWKHLGRWVMERRARYRDQKMSDAQIKKLNALGFSWNVHQEIWQDYYEQLQTFFQENGHCRVQEDPQTTHKMRAWADRQRRNKTKLSKVQVSKLNALNFNWQIPSNNKEVK